MILVLLLLGAVLLPPSAWAGEPRTTMECRPGECINLAEEPRITLEGDCINTMEEAMRAVDEYVQTFLSKEQRKEPGLVFTPVGIKKFEDAVELWKSVIKQCWKNHP